MSQNVIQPTFAAGEMSPSTYGRVDLAKYHAGVALARNFYVDYRGGLSSRFGSAFVGQCKDSSTANRLIPFTFSTLQTYVLVFGNLTMRVVKNGAYVTEPATLITGITQAMPGVVTDTAHGYSTGDLVFLSGIFGMTQMNGRFATVVKIDANTYSLLDMYGVAIATTGYGAYVSGGTAARVFTLVTPYAAADLALLKFSQSADTMTLNHANYPEQQLTRTQHWIWTITPTSFASTTLVPTNVTAAGTTGTTSTTYQYVITAVLANGLSESLASAPGSFTGVTLSANPGAKVTVSWSGNPGDALYNVYRTPESPNGAPPQGALYGYIGSVVPAAANSFSDNSISPDFTHTPPQANNPFAKGAILTVPVTAGGSAYGAAVTLQVTDAGGGTGAQVVPVLVGGAITGVIVIYGGQSYVTPVVSVLNAAGGSGATFGTPTLSTTNYPSCAAYYQQRQVRGGLTSQPQALVFSKTGDFKNMTYSTPGRANDEVQVTLASQTVNPIKHMVPLTALIVLTGSGAWRVDGGSQSDAITPDHINAVPQAYNGCSDVPPIVINYDILYVQAKGSIVRDLSYNFYVNVYTGEDISMLANHLFFGHQITEWCWAEEPFKIIWAVRDDGVMLSLTFLKEQQIYGWARHDSLGLYKSICSISEGNENAVYAIVLRFVNGQYLQYIERFASRNMGGDPSIGIPADVTRAWCVDCGLQYPLAYPIATLTPTEPTNVPVIASVSIVAGGSGYTAPVITVSDPTGTGAVFSPTVVAGVITGVTVVLPGQNYTNPSILITDANGTGAVANAIISMPVPMNASAPIFSVADIGKVVRINGGFGTVLSAPTPTQVIVNVSQTLTSIWPAAPGTWSMTLPVTTVTGLDHLNGQTVSILADGNVQPQQVVANGALTLQTAAAAIVIGLPYVCQVKTLNLDVQGTEGTVQGKRKKIAAVTVRVQDSRGLKVGPNFGSLHEMKERTAEKMGQPVALRTTDQRIIIDPTWTVQGQICIQQDQPLPATVLALIPEILIGDA